jgi:hypothetical protein
MNPISIPAPFSVKISLMLNKRYYNFSRSYNTIKPTGVTRYIVKVIDTIKLIIKLSTDTTLAPKILLRNLAITQFIVKHAH